jgi:hypothetical protein
VKAAAFLAAMLGVVVGLLFGMVLWDGAPEPMTASAGAGQLDAQMLAELRDIRALLERQASVPRPFSSTDPAAPAPAEPQPLTAGTAAGSVEEFRVALDQAVASLRRVAAEDVSGFSKEVVSPDAPAVLDAALLPRDRRKVPQLFGASPRDVYRMLGKPNTVSDFQGDVDWEYGKDWPNGEFVLHVLFEDGYVKSCWVRDL